MYLYAYFSNPSCVPLTRKLLMYRIGGKSILIHSYIPMITVHCWLLIAKEPPEKFSRKKLAEFCHDITGMF